MIISVFYKYCYSLYNKSKLFRKGISSTYSCACRFIKQHFDIYVASLTFLYSNAFIIIVEGKYTSNIVVVQSMKTHDMEK
jgi:hypothetical protein